MVKYSWVLDCSILFTMDRSQAFYSELCGIENLASSEPDKTVFKILHNQMPACEPISARRFWQDLNSVACDIHEFVRRYGLSPGDAVTLWILGNKYIDAVHVLAIMRVGLAPHLCSSTLDDPQLVSSLMQTSNSKALIYDHVAVQKGIEAWNSDIPHHPLFELPKSDAAMTDWSNHVTGFSWHPKSEDVAFILQTSGSVSGTPKPVKRTFQSVYQVTKIWIALREQLVANSKKRIFFSTASFAHGLGLNILLRSIAVGHCQTMLDNATLDENMLGDMAKNHGLNHMVLFAPLLGRFLTAAQQNPKLCELLSALDCIEYGGADLSHDLSDWAFRQRISLKNGYGSTECGVLLASKPDLPSYILYSHPGAIRKFIPLDQENVRDLDSSNDHANLVELVIPEETPECPSRCIQGLSGDFHTGDVFKRLNDGGLIWRARIDDFLKSDMGKKIDAKSLENDIHRHCSDLLNGWVVVGYGRPSPALIVEPKNELGDPIKIDKLKHQVIERIKPLMSKRYPHERIIDAKMILVVNAGNILCTPKGNVRRAAVEAKYKNDLDILYL